MKVCKWHWMGLSKQILNHENQNFLTESMLKE